ncbi:hypothetical protein C0J52_14969 [Blattella germanica]|nr:hypothetical protein C0J52_14969 [Blattella germanica]
MHGCVVKWVQTSDSSEITDGNGELQPFCQILEKIFQKGLLRNSTMGFTKVSESWNWLEQMGHQNNGVPYSFTSSVIAVKSSQKVVTPTGKLRLLIRTCLVNRCLQVPVELLIRKKEPHFIYDDTNSILGDEILGEIFLSVLLQCSRLQFKLNLSNAAFLDETWLLPLCTNFVNSKGVIVGIKSDSVAAEDDKIEVGDILDELNGNHITTSRRGRLSAIMRKGHGRPIVVNIIKAHLPETGDLYPPIIGLLRRAHLDPDEVRSHYCDKMKEGNGEKIEQKKKLPPAVRPGIDVKYVGSVSTGRHGDVKQIEHAVTEVVFKSKEKLFQPVLFEIQEIGVKVLLKHSYMEISSCGRTLRAPNHFAYIAGSGISKNSFCSVMVNLDKNKNDEMFLMLLIRKIEMTPWKELYVALSMIVLAPVVNTQSRPNIVIIMADDMGWGDVGVNWPETVDTPTLDQLTDFHAGASVCTPSRAALLTGRLGLRTGVTKNFGDWALGGIPTNETTIAEILQDAGYKTAMLENSVYRFVPTPRYCFENALPLYENQSIAHQPVSLVNLSTMYADFARNFIQEQNTSEPYFLYAALSHMHVPLAHADRYENITGRGVYADTLREMDGLVESIISVVRETDNNTLIWFTSDNGPWEVKCQYAGSVGPFIGMWQESPEGGGGGSSAKTTIWEAGHRVPSILYWPGHIEMSVVPLLFRDCIDDFRRPLGRDRSFFGEDRDFFSGDRSLRSEFRRPLSIFDQNFGMGMMQDDLLSPSIVSPLRMGYYRPWRTLAPRQSGVSNIQYDKDGFKINLDVQQFKPEELTVKMVNDYVVVEGKHEERQDEHGYISRQFQRRYKLPSDIDPTTVVSELSSDGVLTVTGPKKALPPATPNERVVTITQTNVPAVKQTQDEETKEGKQERMES